MVRIITWLYFITGAVNLTGLLIESTFINQVTKPLLMPLLIFWVFLKAEGNVTLPRLLLAAALIFSWGGDLLLLGQSDKLFFLGGLGSFLIAQLIYVFVLRKSTYHPPDMDWKAISPVFIIGVVFLALVAPKAEQLALPVSVYGVCIIAMVSMARLRKGFTSNESFQWAFIGAVLFLLSDGIIAINKFTLEIPMAHFFIMLTYIPAQYLITKGVMEHAG